MTVVTLTGRIMPHLSPLNKEMIAIMCQAMNTCRMIGLQKGQQFGVESRRQLALNSMQVEPLPPINNLSKDVKNGKAGSMDGVQPLQLG